MPGERGEVGNPVTLLFFFSAVGEHVVLLHRVGFTKPSGLRLCPGLTSLLTSVLTVRNCRNVFLALHVS